MFFSFDRSFNQQPTTFPGMEVILPSSQPEYFQGEELPRTSSPFGVYSHVVLSIRPFVSSFSLWVWWRKQESRGMARIFQKGVGGGTAGTPSGDRRLYMAYTAALPRVSAGLVVLSGHECPY